MLCKGCNREFHSNITKQIFCCRACKNNYYSKLHYSKLCKLKEIKYCITCSKPIETKGTKYCSKKCANKHFNSLEKSNTYNSKVSKWAKKFELIFNIK